MVSILWETRQPICHPGFAELPYLAPHCTWVCSGMRKRSACILVPNRARTKHPYLSGTGRGGKEGSHMSDSAGHHYRHFL